MGATKSKWRGDQLAFFDGATYETVEPFAPTLFYDDFLGTAINGDFWTTLDLNSATFTVPAASYWKSSIGAVAENSAAGLYGKNDKSWNIDKGLIFECRMAVHTAPTLLCEIGFGVMNDSYGAGSQSFLNADEVAKYAFFGFYATAGAGLTAVIRTDDAGVDSGIISTATSVVLNAWHVYRMDFTESSSVKFYIDGARVAASTTFKANTTANLMVQPWLCIYKASDVGAVTVGEMYVDYVRMWQATR